MKKQLRTWPLVVLLLSAAMLIGLCIRSGHNWGGDFALYISQSQALLDGTVQEIYAQNRYQVEHSLWEIGPYLYPFGFPVLLMPVIAFFGISFVALKIWCMIFFIGSLFLIWRIFSVYAASHLQLILLVAFFAVHSEFIIYSDNVLSDIPFMFFVLLSFRLMQLRSSIAVALLTGACIFFAYFIRDAGIALLAALLVLQVTKRKDTAFTWLKALAPYLVFAAGFLIVWLALPRGNENFYRVLADSFSASLITEGIRHYIRLIPEVLFCVQLSFAPSLLIALLFLTATVFSFRAVPHMVVFFILYMVVLLLWPGYGGARYLFPAAPLMIFFLLHFFTALCQRTVRLSRAVIMVLVGLQVILTVVHIRRIVFFSRADTNECCTPGLQRMWTFIGGHVEKDEIIGFFKPHVLRLFTGRNSICADAARWHLVSARYLLIERAELDTMTERPEIVFESGGFVLLQKSGRMP